VVALMETQSQLGMPNPLPEHYADYGPGDWTDAEVRAAMALWALHNPNAGASPKGWMLFLNDARTCFRQL
jgi:hypothetical protein